MEKFILKRRMEKLVISGDTVEYFRYRNPIPVEKFEGTPDPFKQYYRNFDEAGKRQDNIYAARANLRRTIWANVTSYSKFITLTYKNTVLDVEMVYSDLKQFFKRLKRAGYNFPYMYVLERQKKRGILEGNAGCWHVHAIFFSDEILQYDVLNRAWPHGYTEIHKLKDVNNVGAYVSKYLAKDAMGELHKKSYHVSRGLKKPVVLADDGYIGTYGDKLSPILKCCDFKYQNVQHFNVNGVENDILYSQGVMTDEAKRIVNSIGILLQV